jgi:hypothetical protein
LKINYSSTYDGVEVKVKNLGKKEALLANWEGPY